MGHRLRGKQNDNGINGLIVKGGSDSRCVALWIGITQDIDRVTDTRRGR